MKDLSGHVDSSPFDEIHKVAFEFAFNLQEDVLFNQLYSEPATRESALEYMITSPKIYKQIPN